MKPSLQQPSVCDNSGFTLVELIAVLAIMAIMAAAVAPNALRSIERAAVRTEVDTLRTLGEQAKLYLRDTANAPTAANWNTVLAPYTTFSPADLLTNRRQMTRLYVPDPVAANQRGMFLSSMRGGVALPSAATISGTFTTIWNTADGNIPASAGWAAWNATNIEFLVIERVSYAAIYRTDLQSLTITLNNKGAGTASYTLIPADGSAPTTVNILPGTTATIANRRSRDRINLFRAAGGSTLDYSYVLSTTGKTFDFNGTNWTPQ